MLKPGGRFYASTFEVNARMRSDTFRFFQLEELTGLLKKTGFGTVEVRREGVACLIAQCVKGQEEGEEPAASSSLSGDGVVAGEGGGAIR